MEDKGFVNIKFIVFLKATLGKMMGTDILPNGFLDLHFWQSWPRKFYNIWCYDSTKDLIVKLKAFQQHEEQKDKDDSPNYTLSKENDRDYVPEDSPDETQLDDAYSPSILDTSVFARLNLFLFQAIKP